MATREQHAAAFTCAYAFWSPERQTQVFDPLWQNRAPRHAELLALISDPRGLRDAHQPAPGAACPLCGFPAFEWSVGESLPAEITSRIVAEFPTWQPEQGLCNRCRETYEVAVDVRLQAARWRRRIPP